MRPRACMWGTCIRSTTWARAMRAWMRCCSMSPGLIAGKSFRELSRWPNWKLGWDGREQRRRGRRDLASRRRFVSDLLAGGCGGLGAGVVAALGADHHFAVAFAFGIDSYGA